LQENKLLLGVFSGLVFVTVSIQSSSDMENFARGVSNIATRLSDTKPVSEQRVVVLLKNTENYIKNQSHNDSNQWNGLLNTIGSAFREGGITTPRDPHNLIIKLMQIHIKSESTESQVIADLEFYAESMIAINEMAAAGMFTEDGKYRTRFEYETLQHQLEQRIKDVRKSSGRLRAAITGRRDDVVLYSADTQRSTPQQDYEDYDPSSSVAILERDNNAMKDGSLTLQDLQNISVQAKPGIYIQIASVKDGKPIPSNVFNQLEKFGIGPSDFKIKKSSNGWTKVLYGPYSSKAKAQSQLDNQHDVSYWASDAYVIQIK